MGAFYGHYLFALGFPLYGAVLACLKRKRPTPRLDIFLAAGLALLLATPSAWQLSLLADKRQLYSFAPSPTFSSWLLMTPEDSNSICLLIIVTILARVSGLKVEAAWSSKRYGPMLALGLILWLYPSAAVAGVSLILGASVFVPRYFVYAVLGYSLAQAALLCCIRSGGMRVLTFIGILILVISSRFTRPVFYENWRLAISTIESSAPPSTVLMVSPGLCEAREASWLRDQEKQDYLRSPLMYYPVRHPVILLRYPMEGQAHDIFSQAELTLLRQAQRIFIVTPFYIADHWAQTDVNFRANMPWPGADRLYDVVAEKREGGMFVLELKPKALVESLGVS